MNIKRTFVALEFNPESWDDVAPYYEQLQKENPQGVAALEDWIARRDELENVLSECMAWRYIRMTCDTTDKEKEEAYLQFVNEIQPQLTLASDKLNKKLIAHPALQELEQTSDAYRIYFRGLRSAVKMFREENVPLQTELQNLAQKYSSIQGAMSISHDSKEITLQQASALLKNGDRALRKEIFEKIQERRLKDHELLDQLFDEMLALRHRVAVNAGYPDFRAYMFDALGRFDYGIDDCLKFHEAIAEEVVSLNRQLLIERKSALGLENLKPYDLDVDPDGLPPLKPFSHGSELLEKGLKALDAVDPFVGNCLRTMNEMGRLDLESRLGKAPGGYNYPLMETGVPFIFMNAAGTLRDVETLVHEAGHALHSFLCNELPLGMFRNTTAEVAELASMSMELLSMKGWGAFFENDSDLKRAKKEQLQGILSTLPWIATVDAFQHWIYTHPGHTAAERRAQWLSLGKRFGTGLVDWSDYPQSESTNWQRQLHIFELPFYYVEYGFAQLGAIAVWKRFLLDESSALKDYMHALKLGYTRSIPELYEQAGVRFAFDAAYVRELMQSVWEYRKKLN